MFRRSLNIVSAWIGLVMDSSGQNSFVPPYWVDKTNFTFNNLVGTAETNDTSLNLTASTNQCNGASAYYIEMNAKKGTGSARLAVLRYLPFVECQQVMSQFMGKRRSH